jgi:hypothetical protein
VARSKLILGALALAASSCGSSASPAAPVVSTASSASSASGVSVWVGTIDRTSCTGNLACAGFPIPFILRLAADGSGYIQINTTWNAAAGGEWSVPLSSTTLAGVTVLRGTATGGPWTPVSTLDVSLTMRQGDVATATIQYTLSMQEAPDSRTSGTVSGRVSSVRKDTTVFGGRFEGNWRGMATRTSCSGNCFLDPIFPNGSTAFSFSQSGATVSDGVFVGTAIGNSLTGSGHSHYEGPCKNVSYAGVVCVVFDYTISITVDEFDQWHGTISYHMTGVDSENGDRPVDVTGTGKLDGLGRWIS